jgi:hypothetical protein
MHAIVKLSNYTSIVVGLYINSSAKQIVQIYEHQHLCLDIQVDKFIQLYNNIDMFDIAVQHPLTTLRIHLLIIYA